MGEMAARERREKRGRMRERDMGGRGDGRREDEKKGMGGG